MSTFTFQARWKEELVVTGPGGRFILELPMGVLSAYLPPEEIWMKKAPSWAKPLYPQIKQDLKKWCGENKAKLVIDKTASVFRAT